MAELKKRKRRNLRKLILYITNRWPETKRSYPMLVMMTWIVLGFKNKAIRITKDGTIWIKLDAMDQLPSPESITRCFRKLVEQGIIQLPPEEIKRRRLAEEYYRLEYASDWEEFP